jgi:hypothetical protein
MVLTHELQVDYLANVIGMARANGKFFPQEKAAIQSIQLLIGAADNVLTEAYDMAKQTDFTPKTVGLWADQVKNLEHIIYLSLLDGKIDNDEKRYIVQFAKKIKLSQEQLNLIIHDVQQSASTMLKAPAASATATAPVYDIPTTGIAIEFASPSEAGVSLAMKSMAFANVQKTCEKHGQSWHLAAWSKEQMIDALPLIEAVKQLPCKHVYVDGEERTWDSVFAFSRCANQRAAAYRPEAYCFGVDDMKLNLWGCRSIGMAWREWEDWLSYGSFKDSDRAHCHVFVFDKARIRHELENNLHGCQLCPHVQHNVMDAVLEALPDEVTVSHEGDWLYKKDYRETPGAVLVEEPIYMGRHSSVKTYYSSAVVPSVDVGIKLLKQACAKCDLPIEYLSSLDQYKE